MQMRFILFLLILYISIGCETRRAKPGEDDLDMSAILLPVPEYAVLEDSTYFTWGASPIKGDDGLYHLYYSRWKKKYGFLAWVTHSEIAHAVATDLLGPYKFKDVALPARGTEFWDGTTTHNPTIHKFGNNYYLYYMGNKGDGVNIKNALNWTHRNSQRIGVAVSSSPDGPWKRFERPLIDVSPDSTAADALAVNNPSVVKRPDGKIQMVYKAVARKKPLPFGGPVVHLTAIADSPTGPFVKNPDPIFTKENSFFAAEDPYVWCQKNRYYAIVKDMNGEFTKKGRSLALFTSEDGENWTVAKHTLVSDLILKWDNGRCDSVYYLERPQLYLENGHPKALFLAVSPTKENKHTYNVHIPLKVE